IDGRLVAHPVVQVPVQARAELIGFLVEAGHVLRGIDVIEEDPRLLALKPGIAEPQLPGSPAPSGASRSFGAEYRMLDARRTVFRPSLSSEQVGSGAVPGPEPNSGKVLESKSAELQCPDAGPVEHGLDIFIAEAPGAVQEGELTLVTPHVAVDRELREESIGAIRKGHPGRELAGKPARIAVGHGSAEGEALEHAALVFAPGIEADAAHSFRHARGVVDPGVPFPVKYARPVLHDAAVQIAVNQKTGAAEGRACRGIQEGLQAPLNEIEVGNASHDFLGEGLLELPALHLEFRVVFEVQVDVADGGSVLSRFL